MAKKQILLTLEFAQLLSDAQKKHLGQKEFIAELSKILDQDVECQNCGCTANAKNAAKFGKKWEFSVNCPNCGVSWGGVISA